MQQGLNIVNPYQTLKDRVNGINSMVIKSSQTLKCDNLIFGTESSIVHGSIVNTLPAHSGELYVEKNYHLSNDTTKRTGILIDSNTVIVDEKYENNFETDQYVYIRGAGTLPVGLTTKPIAVSVTTTSQSPQYRYQYCVITVKKLIDDKGISYCGGFIVGPYSGVVYNISKLNDTNYNTYSWNSEQNDTKLEIVYRKALDDSETKSGYIVAPQHNSIDDDSINSCAKILDENFYLSDIIPEEGRVYPGDLLTKVTNINDNYIFLEDNCSTLGNVIFYHDNTIPLNSFFSDAATSNKTFTLGGSEDVFMVCDRINLYSNTKVVINCSIMPSPFIYFNYSLLYSIDAKNIELFGSYATTKNNIDGNMSSSLSYLSMWSLVVFDASDFVTPSLSYDYKIQLKNLTIGNIVLPGSSFYSLEPVIISQCKYTNCMQGAIWSQCSNSMDIQCVGINCGLEWNNIDILISQSTHINIHDSVFYDSIFSTVNTGGSNLSKISASTTNNIIVNNCMFINPKIYACKFDDCVDATCTNNYIYCPDIEPQNTFYLKKTTNQRLTVTGNVGNNVKNIIANQYQSVGANLDRIYDNVGNVMNDSDVRLDVPTTVTVNATGVINYNQFPCNGNILFTSGTISSILLNNISIISNTPVGLPFSFPLRTSDTYVVNYSDSVVATFIPSQ